VRTKNNVRDIYEDATIKIHKPDAAKVTPIKINLLSILSDKYPMGHCDKAPKEVMIIIKMETSKILKPFEVAYTAPYPKTTLCARPVKSAPTKPRGEIT
tara:strand:- start:59 stop:355 length:297 start_codon:yes stop_codon:yes gene_type:complete